MKFHQVSFQDPLTGNRYDWPVNPSWDAESKAGTGYQQKARQIERTSNTGNNGATRQQGDDGPYILHWEFPCFTGAHEKALFQWYALCDTQSIYLNDLDGEQYEGQIITLGRMRSGVSAGPGDITTRGFYSQMLMEFEVYHFLTGLLKDSGLHA